jgi:hypothetical protein
LVTDTHIMSRWRIYFSHLLNVCGVNDVRETEIHSAEPLLSEPNVFEVGMTMEKLK